MGLLRGADSTELKLTVPPASHRDTIQGLPIDPVETQPRQVYFFDTPDLALTRAGLVVRARRTQGGKGDTVIKLRPVDPADLSPEMRADASFNVEVDVLPGGYVCSASFKGRTDGARSGMPCAADDRSASCSRSRSARSTSSTRRRASTSTRSSPLGPTFCLKGRFDAQLGGAGRPPSGRSSSRCGSTRTARGSSSCRRSAHRPRPSTSRPKRARTLPGAGSCSPASSRPRPSTALEYYAKQLAKAAAEGDLTEGRRSSARSRGGRMRRFVVEALVDAASLVVIFFVLSLIPVPSRSRSAPTARPIVELTSGPLGVLVAAAILVLAERFVRPVIIAFTGRLLLSTFGLFMVIVNAVVIWVASLVAPDIARAPSRNCCGSSRSPPCTRSSPRSSSAVLGLNRPQVLASGGTPGGLAVARFAADAAPQPDPREPPPPADLRGRLRRRPRLGPRPDAGRPAAAVVLSVVLGEPELVVVSGPARFRELLQQLGPTYVKIGQMIASRSDVLPPELIEELSKLQSDAAPFPWDDARPVIQSELGRPPEELFATIEHEPFAAASTAQVHRATLHDGTRGRGQGPAAADRRQDQGRPRRHHRARHDRRATPAHRPEGRPAQPRQRVRRRRPQGARLPQRGVPREAPGGQPRSLRGHRDPADLRRAVGLARADDGVRARDQGLRRRRRCARPASTPTSSGARSSGRSSSRSSSTASSTATRTRATCSPTPRSGSSSSWTSVSSGSSAAPQRVDLLGLIYAVKEVDIPGIADGLIALGKPTPSSTRPGSGPTSTASPASTSSTARPTRSAAR